MPLLQYRNCQLQNCGGQTKDPIGSIRVLLQRVCRVLCSSTIIYLDDGGCSQKWVEFDESNFTDYEILLVQWCVAALKFLTTATARHLISAEKEDQL